MRALRIGCVLLVLLASQMSGPLSAQQTEEEREGIIVASAWLQLLDAGDYEGSWEVASPTLRNYTSSDRWISRISSLQRQHGRIVSRQPPTFSRPAPGSANPPGEYLILIYPGSFANLPSGSEMVLLRHEGERGWKVFYYDILTVPGRV